MNSLTITAKPAAKRRITIELDANRFERLAADLGLLRKEFIDSVDHAEQEIVQGKARRLHSLKDFRRP